MQLDHIPEFPKFKEIELSDKPAIKAFTSQFPPYSDYNFTALWSWSWNKEKKMMISQLNGNFVVLFNDYDTNKCFLSFLGIHKVSETADTLTAYSKKHYETSELKLIPEITANLLPKSEFVVADDRDSYDYIYSLADLANMNTWTKNSSSRSNKKNSSGNIQIIPSGKHRSIKLVRMSIWKCSNTGQKINILKIILH